MFWYAAAAGGGREVVLLKRTHIGRGGCKLASFRPVVLVLQ
jgi:hypothetical protein